MVLDCYLCYLNSYLAFCHDYYYLAYYFHQSVHIVCAEPVRYSQTFIHSFSSLTIKLWSLAIHEFIKSKDYFSKFSCHRTITWTIGTNNKILANLDLKRIRMFCQFPFLSLYYVNIIMVVRFLREWREFKMNIL